MRPTSRSPLSGDSRKALGFALLVFGAAFSYLSAIARPSIEEVAALFLISLGSTLMGRASAHSSLARVAVMALAVAGIGATVYSVYFPGALREYLRTRGMIEAATVVSSLLLAKSDGAGPQKRALWMLAIAALPPLFTRAAGGSYGMMSAAFILVPLLLGSVLYLWETGPEAGDNKTLSYLLQSGVAILAVALLMVVIARPMALAAKALYGFAIDAFIYVLLIILKPIGILAERLLEMLEQRLGQISEGTPIEFGRFEPKPIDEVAEWQPTFFTTVLEYALSAAIVLVVAYFVWRAVKAIGSRKPAAVSTSSELGGPKRTVLEWASDKGKEFLTGVSSAIKDIFASRRHEDPLIALYLDFQSVVKKAGFERALSQTPLEFSLLLTAAMPELAEPVSVISSSFARHYYSETRPDPSEMGSLRAQLETLRKTITQRGNIPLDRPEVVG